jgi:plastocyanin
VEFEMPRCDRDFAVLALSVCGLLQQPGAEFKVPFVKPGTYQVSCGIHPKMKLSVTVK